MKNTINIQAISVGHDQKNRNRVVTFRNHSRLVDIALGCNQHYSKNIKFYDVAVRFLDFLQISHSSRADHRLRATPFIYTAENLVCEALYIEVIAIKTS